MRIPENVHEDDAAALRDRAVHERYEDWRRPPSLLNYVDWISNHAHGLVSESASGRRASTQGIKCRVVGDLKQAL
jgi:hypothetical protein